MRAEYVTRPREQIVGVLGSERRYLSAADVYALLKKARARVSLSTVYRTLDMLEAKGDISSRVDEQGEATYVVCTTRHHHHAICRKCGKVDEVDCGAMDGFATALRKHHGFALDDHAMEFFGRCSACQ
ncbi:MAG: transcriptional repressor [Candidatus Eremiobacteraeota bacterium]|nr:transcriptional repressor [Candidatus Eremiobacteraeota bacterium]